MDLVGQVLQDTYRVERLLGRGGMGEVFLASHLRLPRQFAIKVLYPSLGYQRAEVARFRREAEIVSALGHPHIVEVIDFNHTSDGAPYIVMEYLEGEDLGTRLSRLTRLSLEAAASLLRQAASAIHAAHCRGIIHRDVKPRNIFLCVKSGRSDYVKVVDFGLSKVTGSQTVVTNSQMAIGTPRYMAPEQALGHSAQVDARTDVFGMGAVLYRALSGQLPFPGEQVQAVLHNVVYIDPPELDSLELGISADVARVVAKALAKHREDRYPSMEALARAFLTSARGRGDEDLLSGDPLWSETAVKPFPPDPGAVTAPVDGQTELVADASPPAAAVEDRTAELAPESSTTWVSPRPSVSPHEETRRLRSAVTVPPHGDERSRRRRLAALITAGLGLLACAAGVWIGHAVGGGDLPAARLDVALVAAPTDSVSAVVVVDRGPVRPDLGVPDTSPGKRVRLKTADAATKVEIPPQRVEPSQRRRLRPGRLRIVTRLDGELTWSYVIVDGKQVGQSPLMLERPAGAHRVEVKRPGYQGQHKTVVVRAGQESKVLLELKR